MMILKRRRPLRRRLDEADEKPAPVGDQGAGKQEEAKPTCQVHGGNIFVQLHFKAVEEAKKQFNDVLVANTVVTDKNQQNAEFSGCGDHLIVVASAEEDVPLMKDRAVKCMQAYASVMFGKDVGDSIKDVQCLDADGDAMTDEDLAKFAEKQKNGEAGPGEKGGEGGKGDAEAEEDVDESIPGFGRFLAEAEEDEENGDGDSDEENGDGDSDEELGDEDGYAEDANEDNQEEDADEDNQEEDGEEDTPPPAVYMVKYLIKADGQPEKDHTKDPDQLKELLGGKFKTTDGNFNFGIKFYNGGEVNFKKLAKEVGGEVDDDELEKNVKNIMRANFPTINIPTVQVRDKRTADLGIKKMIKDKKVPEEEYTAQVQSQLDSAPYNLWIEVSDFKEKPFIGKKELVGVVNDALKKAGGRWLKIMSGIKADDIILIHGLSTIEKTEQDIDKVRRKIPNPSEIKKYIDSKLNNLNSAWVMIDKKFDDLAQENIKTRDGVAEMALSMWNKFKKSKNNSSDGVELKDYNAFCAEYEKFYKEEVASRLSESFLTEYALMESLFSDLYEADTDEDADKDAGDIGFSDDPSDEEEFDGDGGGSADGKDGGSDGGDDGENSEEGFEHAKDDHITNIFIIPMKNLDVDIDKSARY